MSKKHVFFLLIAIIFPLKGYSQEIGRSSEIELWEKVIPHKGFILSVDLFEKKCAKIWSEQIKEFMKKNPHIKDPNYILQEKEIWVQRCKAQSNKLTISEEKYPQESNVVKKENKLYLSLYSGVYSSRDNRFESNGYNIGISLGKSLEISESIVFNLGIGVMQNRTQVFKRDMSEVSLVTTRVIVLESLALYGTSDRIRTGITLNLYTNGNDSSFSEKVEKEEFLAYAGLAAQVHISDSIFGVASITQKLKYIESNNLMINLGVKIEF